MSGLTRGIKDGIDAVGDGMRRYGRDLNTRQKQSANKIRDDKRAAQDWDGKQNTPTPTVRANYIRGKNSETKVPGAQSSRRIPAPSGRAAYRMPDRHPADGGVLGDIKDVNTQGLSSQMRDFLAYAQQNGLDFHLFVRKHGPDGTGGTHITKPLQDIIDAGPTAQHPRIIVHREDF